MRNGFTVLDLNKFSRRLSKDGPMECRRFGAVFKRPRSGNFRLTCEASVGTFLKTQPHRAMTTCKASLRKAGLKNNRSRTRLRLDRLIGVGTVESQANQLGFSYLGSTC